jgi:hypothetical protein
VNGLLFISPNPDFFLFKGALFTMRRQAILLDGTFAQFSAVAQQTRMNPYSITAFASLSAATEWDRQFNRNDGPISTRNGGTTYPVAAWGVNPRLGAVIPRLGAGTWSLGQAPGGF